MTTAEALREKLAPDIDRHDNTVKEHVRDTKWVKELRESIRQIGSGQISNWRDMYSRSK